jgi:hydroxymethylpyrimidine pyrophosphatase-like HAD family hydrolase
MFAHKKHFFFDLDKTIAPARQPILSEMFDLLSTVDQDIIIVSGQEVPKIKWQSNQLPAVRLGQNGNHAVEIDETELWNIPLSNEHQQEILEHINALLTIVDHEVNHCNIAA